MTAIDLDMIERDLREKRGGRGPLTIYQGGILYCEGPAVLALIDRLREAERKLRHRCWSCGRLANDTHEDGCEEGPTDTDRYMKERAWRAERGALTPEEEEDDRIEAEARERELNPDAVLEHLLDEEDPVELGPYDLRDGEVDQAGSSFGADP